MKSDREILTEGKTKIIYSDPKDKKGAILHSKDDITAGDGAKHDVIEGKAKLANNTTCNIFRLLKKCGIPVAFYNRDGETSFRAPLCDMILYEVVARREAHGSYIKRNPQLAKEQIFPSLVIEFFLKTSGKEWNGHRLPEDDPLVVFDEDNHEAALYNPKIPLWQQEPFLVLKEYPLYERGWKVFWDMARITRQTFLVLERAWQLLGHRLVDFKVEFGFVGDKVFLADVITNDEWRLIEGVTDVSKQSYRDGKSLETIEQQYRRVSALTDRFGLPKQQIICWRGSRKDDIGVFEKAYEPYLGDDCQMVYLV